MKLAVDAVAGCRRVVVVRSFAAAKVKGEGGTAAAASSLKTPTTRTTTAPRATMRGGGGAVIRRPAIAAVAAAATRTASTLTVSGGRTTTTAATTTAQQQQQQQQRPLESFLVGCRRRSSRSRDESVQQRQQQEQQQEEEEVRIVEVGPRDGLQNERTIGNGDDGENFPTTEQKIEFVRRLVDAGCRHVEIGSFVSPKAVPAMADTERVVLGLKRRRRRELLAAATAATAEDHSDLVLSCLVPNVRGLEAALRCNEGGVDDEEDDNKNNDNNNNSNNDNNNSSNALFGPIVNEIAVFASASETFSQRNIGCSIEESFERFRDVVELLREKEQQQPTEKRIRVRGYVSCVAGCPYEGSVPPSRVAKVAERMLDELGCYEVSLGDTIGVGTPASVLDVLREVQGAIVTEQQSDPQQRQQQRLAVHFHDTYGQALANILVSLERGIRVVDSSAAGLGGCPYAGGGATGNVATEDVVYMLDGMNVRTGIDLDKLVDASEYVCGILKKESRSRAGTAILAAKKRARGRF